MESNVDSCRERVLELHGQGLSRAQITERVPVSAWSVSKIVASAGRSFADTSRTANATQERLKRLAEKRLCIAENGYDTALSSLNTFDEPYLVYSFGGRNNTFHSHLIDGPQPIHRRDIAQTVSLLVTTAARQLSTIGPAADESDVDAWLGAMGLPPG